MYKQLMSILLILSVPLTTYAFQPQQGSSGLPDKTLRIEHLTKALGLNKKEKTKVEAIINDEKMKIGALHEESRTRLQGLLTEEQMAEFDALAQQRHHP
ncbi:MAG: hypothetical protein PHY16_01085 [Methylobacter sp.]|nr:hypothetical protein [Methylobacter sp.]